MIRMISRFLSYAYGALEAQLRGKCVTVRVVAQAPAGLHRRGLAHVWGCPGGAVRPSDARGVWGSTGAAGDVRGLPHVQVKMSPIHAAVPCFNICARRC